jgi:hypothetical protein
LPLTYIHVQVLRHFMTGSLLKKLKANQI